MPHTVSRTKILLLVAVLVIGFPALWQAARLFAGSPVTDDFSDTTKIASSENLSIDTVTGRVMLTANATWTCGQPFTDTRDGRQYATVQIGDQCWMQENLNVGTMITSCTNGYVGACTTGGDTVQNQGTSCSSVQKYCYGDTDANCTTNGGLYQWAQAMCGASSCNGTGAPPDDACSSPVQGICPAGWHIPSHHEFTTLERAVCTSGTCVTDFPYDITTTGWRGTNEGTRLKAGGTSGFEGLLAGGRDTGGSFSALGTYGGFWSSVQSGANAWRRHLNSGNATVNRNANSQLNGFSVRCLKDWIA